MSRFDFDDTVLDEEFDGTEDLDDLGIDDNGDTAEDRFYSRIYPQHDRTY